MDKKLLEIFRDDPETLAILRQTENSYVLKELLKQKVKKDAEAKTVKIEFLKGEQGEPLHWEDLTDEQKAEIKGEKGDTPVKGEDYFTNEEINQVADYIKGVVKEEVRPIKGKDYNDGRDADENKIIREVSKKIPTKEEIASLVKIPQPKEPKEIDVDFIVKEVLKLIPKTDVPEIKDIIKEIKTKKLIEMRDIKNMPLNMGDMRWHGGGDTVSAGTNITITTVNGKKVINATGSGGSGYQVPLSGGLTGTNTWATAPNVIVVDGVPMQKTRTDGTPNWTGTTTTVLTALPAYDVFASA